MSTVAISGKNGSLTGPTGSEVKKWTATIKYELLDATSFSSNGYREYVLGLYGCTGTFDAVGSPPSNGNVATLSLITTTGGHTISGNAKVEDVTYDVPVDGLVGYSASFKMSGSITVG